MLLNLPDRKGGFLIHLAITCGLFFLWTETNYTHGEVASVSLFTQLVDCSNPRGRKIFQPIQKSCKKETPIKLGVEFLTFVYFPCNAIH
jgi:hypothetical protein